MLAEVGVGVPLDLALALHAGVHLVQTVINSQTGGEVLLLLMLVGETSGTSGHPPKVKWSSCVDLMQAFPSCGCLNFCIENTVRLPAILHVAMPLHAQMRARGAPHEGQTLCLHCAV